jgi:outer membrane protein assembly factor BamA
MNFCCAICFAITLLVQQTSAQQDSIPPSSRSIIDTVIISGNAKTKAYVILNEMRLKPGSIATPELIEFDRNRIYSLGLFTRVDIFFDSLNTSRFLLVDVSERWYILPLPLFGFRDGDPKKPYYGAGLLHNNFRGRNQKLFGSVTFGYNPSFAVSFLDPLLDTEHNLYFSGNTSYSIIRNKSEIESAITGDFDERHYEANLALGKRFSLYETAGLEIGYRVVSVGSYRPGRTVSPSGRDNFITGGINFTFDSRDLREYASKGMFLYFSITKLGFGEGDLNFARFGADIRRYVPLPLDFTFAARVHGTIVSGGTVPTHSRAYFGYGERIRGYFRDVFEGENLFGTSLELRFALLKPRTITFTAIPIPEEFAVWRFGISLALFVDTGVTWFRGQGITLSSFASGYGGGIHFLLPYSYVVRTECAYNEYFKGQFILAVRTSI